MFATGNKKMLIILILNILKEYSDVNHKLTQKEIMHLLKSNYDMECDRRSVKNNIQCLKELGYEISADKGYYLIEREFDDAELRMLIDSVLFSKNLTQCQAKNLIEKLKKMSNRYFYSKVSHVSNLPELHHGDNKHLMYAVYKINEAISQNKKISFIYNAYGEDLKLHPKREEAYLVNPYQMVANNGRYYLIGNYDKYDNISHYRIDKMTQIEIVEERVKPTHQVKDTKYGFNLPKHMAEHIYMFSGPSIKIKLAVEDSIFNDLIDWFGKDFYIVEKLEDGRILISLKCNEQAFFYWALQYGVYVEVIEPLQLRAKVGEAVKKMYERYSE